MSAYIKFGDHNEVIKCPNYREQDALIKLLDV